MVQRPVTEKPRNKPVLHGVQGAPAQPSPEREEALARLPGCMWLMSAAHDQDRAGLIVRWVQRAGDEPPLVSVAMRKGHPIEPLIRDSRAFALSMLTAQHASLERRFGNGLAERIGDPFDTIDTARLVSRAPCLRTSPTCIDCELFRRVDLEAETCLYVGLVLATRTA